VTCDEARGRGDWVAELLFARSRIASMVRGSGDDFRGTGDGENLPGNGLPDLLRVEEILAHSPTKSFESLSCGPNASSESRSAPTNPW